ncbi:MAG: asparagine synthase (glutamine-hydrolyzing) [Candidatus Nanopelagicales bacterium]
MCGIAGVLGPPSQTQALITPMLDVIRHRGPDDSGVYVGDEFAFGMRRLSIIDIAGGHQPMWSQDGSVGIVYNGELYNYREINERLAAQGQLFQTQSDTETLIHLYERVGRQSLPEMMRQLRGMFGFAIYDRDANRLILGRDHFGIKPLYYRLESRDGVPALRSFGSEIKSLLVDPSCPREVNRDAVVNYLSFQYNPLDETFFRGIHRLPPGSFGVVDLATGSLTVEPYWLYEFDGSGNDDEAALIGQVRSVLEDSVEHHLIADVPVGAFLSGGIDSAITVTLVQERRRALGLEPLKTFTVGFDSVSEQPQAREVAERLGTDHHDVHVSVDDYLAVLPEIAWYFDEPVADPSAVALYFVAKAAREHVTVVLSGEGADELFGGYRIYREPLDLDRIRRLPRPLRSLAARASRSTRSFPGRNYLRRAATAFNERYIGNAYIFRPEEVRRLLRTPPEHDHVVPGRRLAAVYPGFDSLPESRRMQLVDLHYWLRGDILAKADRMTMAHSLELRVPYLDVEVAELSATIPDSLKYRDGTTKWLLRRAFRGRVPEATEHRDKLGFPTPLRVWLRSDPDAVLAPIRRSAFLADLVDMNVVEQLAVAHVAGEADNSRKIFVLLMLALWHEALVEGDPSSKP